MFQRASASSRTSRFLRHPSASSTGGEVETDSHALQEYARLIMLFLLLSLLLSVFSYQPADPSFFVSVYQSNGQAAEPENLFGPFGASLAEGLFQLFGLMSMLSLVISILQAVQLLLISKARGRVWVRFFGLMQFTVFAGVLAHLVFGSVFYRGSEILVAGLTGEYFAELIVAGVGRTGALIAASFGIISALPLLTGVRLLRFLQRFMEMVPSRKVKAWAQVLLENDSSVKPEVYDVSRSAGSIQLGRSGQGFLKRLGKKIAAAPQKVTQGATAVSHAPCEKLDDREPPVQCAPPGAEESRAEHVILPRKQVEVREVTEFTLAKIVGVLRIHDEDERERRRELEKARLVEEAKTLVEKLETFGVSGTVRHSQPGPVVNVHEFEPAPGVKVGKVTGLQEDLALGLKAKSVLMGPQAGKSTIGIEIPAVHREVVSLKELICTREFQETDKPLSMVLGKNVDGTPLLADLASMPHLLVAGATGSGKSVAINVILLSLLISHQPDELRLILVDPKMLELSNYDGIGHLLLPVVTAPEKAAGALKWVIAEMERRYAMLKECQVRNIKSYHELPVEKRPEPKLPYIVVVIDELCDLMMTAPKDVEDSVQRLAQKARAAGIHLILATQRPSVDVLTGVIKANLPCRISFQVSSRHDSRTIIEAIGAEKLLGKGDMLYVPPGTSKIKRAHCAFVSDEEVNEVCRLLRESYPAQYESTVMSEVESASQDVNTSGAKAPSSDDYSSMSDDHLYELAVEYARSVGKVSTSSLQRNFRVGYNKAARLMDRMDREGIVGPADVAGKPREVVS